MPSLSIHRDGVDVTVKSAHALARLLDADEAVVTAALHCGRATVEIAGVVVHIGAADRDPPSTLLRGLVTHRMGVPR